MEKQIENILIKVDEGTMPVQQALTKLLRLLGVSKRFCLCTEPDEHWDSGQTCFCGKCNKLVNAC